MIPALLIIIYLIVLIASGFAMLCWLWPRDRETPAEIWLPLSFALGVGLQTFLFMLSLALFREIHDPVYWAGVVLLGAATIAMRTKTAASAFTGMEILAAPANPKYRFLYWFLLAVAVLFISFMFWNALSYPMASYDGRAIWNFKAKILFHERTVFTPSFFNPARVHYHTDYPLMIPMAEFGLYRFVGAVDEERVRFFFSTLFLFFSMLLYGVLRRPVGKIPALFIAVIFAALPYRPYWVVRDGGAINSGESDLPLSFFGFALFVLNYWWWKTAKNRYLYLAGVLVGYCLMTKKEGMVVFAVFLAVNGLRWLFVQSSERWPRARQLVLATGIAVLAALPWFIVGSQLPNYFDEDYSQSLSAPHLTGMITRMPVILSVFWNDVSEIDKWNIVWFLFPVAIVLNAALRWEKRDFFFDACILLWLAAYAVVYMLSPLDLVFHTNTSMRRLLAHVFPLVLLNIGLLFGVLRHYLAPPDDSEERPNRIDGRRLTIPSRINTLNFSMLL